MTATTTVLVTGAGGFVATRVVLELLRAGYRVVGSVRQATRAEEVRDAVRQHLPATAALDENLRFVTLDLTQDAGWSEAMAGVDVLMHTASPLPMEQPRDETELIRPAVDGTLRALGAARAAGIRRVVLTSSSAAITNQAPRPDKERFDESDWSDPEWPGITPYAKSKTLAERAAWDYVAEKAPDMELTAINPCLVLGRPLDDRYGTSLRIVERLLRGRDPMVPNVGVPVVDIDDVARMHVRAVTAPGAAGKRILGAAAFMWLAEVSAALKADHPQRRVPTRTAPDFLIHVVSLFDRSIRAIVPLLGRRYELENARARTLLDLDFIPGPDSVRATGRYIVERGLAG
ncbi:MAG: NAD-dependent epimerase/dehydratase family protein [Deltaproteobacteria bacterium]|nr:NAD-dependent epimerase/dehydratase family protein [Deltaproteobacteria bacterium]